MSNFDTNQELKDENEAKKINFKVDNYLTENITTDAATLDKKTLVVDKVYASEEHGLVRLTTIEGSTCQVVKEKDGTNIQVASDSLSKAMAVLVNAST